MVMLNNFSMTKLGVLIIVIVKQSKMTRYIFLITLNLMIKEKTIRFELL